MGGSANIAGGANKANVGCVGENANMDGKGNALNVRNDIGKNANVAGSGNALNVGGSVGSDLNMSGHGNTANVGRRRFRRRRF